MTIESGWKPTKGWLRDKKIPRNEKGDPEFTELGCERTLEDLFTKDSFYPTALLAQFTPEQIVYLANKQLYALEYQREAHRNRAQEETERLAPLKKKAKEMFGTSFMKLTPTQLAQAAIEVQKERTLEALKIGEPELE